MIFPVNTVWGRSDDFPLVLLTLVSERKKL